MSQLAGLMPPGVPGALLAGRCVVPTRAKTCAQHSTFCLVYSPDKVMPGSSVARH
jgi:hypothetical protein